MPGTPAAAADDDSKQIAEPPGSLDEWVGRLMSEQIGSSVYAAHWQRMSGFFDGTPKSPEHRVDWTAPPKT
jgi:hypothetical protein